MKELTESEKEGIIQLFLDNIKAADAGEHLQKALDSFIVEKKKIPIIHSPELFLDCFMAYFTQEEEYENCAKLQLHREDLLTKFVSIEDLDDAFDIDF